MERDLLDKLKARVELAKEIDKIQHKATKEKALLPMMFFQIQTASTMTTQILKYSARSNSCKSRMNN